MRYPKQIRTLVDSNCVSNSCRELVGIIGAEREFRRAIELNPNYSVAHHWYAIYLSVVGRQREALAEIRRAQELDPLAHRAPRRRIVVDYSCHRSSLAWSHRRA